jgi:putative transposase
MTRRYYSSDLTNREWAILAPLIPPPKPGGRSVSWERREIVDAILYELRSGGPWRMLPHDFPPWQTVYHSFRLWRLDGTWERVHTRLREQARRRVGRETSPSAAILDSQSVKTTEKGGSVATTAAKR